MRTPEQILGPYFPMQIRPMASGDLTKLDGGSEPAQGEIVQMVGQIRNLEGEPVRGATMGAVPRHQSVGTRSPN